MSASYALSVKTRADSFSDYIKLDAYKSGSSEGPLATRADIALGSATPVKTWFIPMPQMVERLTTHNYEVVEQSIAYSMQKGTFQGRQAQVDAAAVATAAAKLGTGIGENLGSANAYGLQDALGGLLYLSGIGSTISGAIGLLPTLQDFQQNLNNEFSDEPTVGLSTQELKYGGTIERSYKLDYQFIAKEAADVYGPTGILQIIAELESWSFPVSFDDVVSKRDLIKTPPIFTLKHVRVVPGGGFQLLNDSAPLAALGQPQLLVLRKVGASHETKSVILDGDFTYPTITNLSLELADMEPLARLDDSVATYGGIQVPKIACRSEIYARAKTGRGSTR